MKSFENELGLMSQTGTEERENFGNILRSTSDAGGTDIFVWRCWLAEGFVE